MCYTHTQSAKTSVRQTGANIIDTLRMKRGALAEGDRTRIGGCDDQSDAITRSVFRGSRLSKHATNRGMLATH